MNRIYYNKKVAQKREQTKTPRKQFWAASLEINDSSFNKLSFWKLLFTI